MTLRQRLWRLIPKRSRNVVLSVRGWSSTALHRAVIDQCQVLSFHPLSTRNGIRLRSSSTTTESDIDSAKGMQAFTDSR